MSKFAKRLKKIMKMKLMNHVGRTLHFSGIFNELTFIKNTGLISVLIKPVYHDGHIICDHAWISIAQDNNPFKMLEINKYDEISFNATVEQYIKNGGHLEYGLSDISNITLIKRGNGYDYVNRIQKFQFQVMKESKIKIFGGKSIIAQQQLDKPLMQGVHLQPGDTITCEFVGAANDRLEFRLRTDRMKEGYWIKKIYFNPLRTNQTLSVRGYFSILLPAEIYAELKRGYFKIFCTKTDIKVA